VWLRHCLVPLKGADGTAVHPAGARPTSLCRALLSIPSVQPRLAAALLERIPEFATGADEDESAPGGAGGSGGRGGAKSSGHSAQTIPQLLLSQFRWLDQVVDPEELAAKMLDLVEALPARDVKRDIVLCLPDVIDDRAAAAVVSALRDKLEDGGDAELTVPILDALSNLCLTPEDTEAVRAIVLAGLDAHEPDAMPVRD
jgi:Fanconi anemia group D2 protein